MAVVCRNSHGWVLDQEFAINREYAFVLYVTSTSRKYHMTSLKMKNDFFQINSSFIMDSQWLVTRNKNVFSNVFAYEQEKGNSSKKNPDALHLEQHCSDGSNSELESEQKEMFSEKFFNLFTVTTNGPSQNTDTGSALISKRALKRLQHKKFKNRQLNFNGREETHSSDNEGLKKQREYHNKIRRNVLSCYNELAILGKLVGIFSEETFRGDNNVSARLAADKLTNNETLATDCTREKNAGTCGQSCVVKLTCELIHMMTLGRTSYVNYIFIYDRSTPIVITLNGTQYIIPGQCSFLISDISNISILHRHEEFQPFDFIVMDPPWTNKSIRRKKLYDAMSNKNLLDIPLSTLSAKHCLVAVWVTNKWTHIDFVKKELFPHYSIQFLAEWHWVKVTTSGKMVLDMENQPKKPYETLLIGCYHPDQGELTPVTIPNNKVLLSVPCSLHSSKPTLQDVFREFLPPSPRCLELFARNLQPGWTSWGNEVLKHQDIQLFEVSG